MSFRIGFVPSRRQTPSVEGRHLSLFDYRAAGNGVVRRRVVGILTYSAADLLALRAEGSRLDAVVVGRFRLSDDVTEHLAASTIARVRVVGDFRASGPVKRALEHR